MQLTFLNLTNAPNLKPAELKLVRGHVTKSNFERRRIRQGGGGKDEAEKPPVIDESRDGKSTTVRSLRAGGRPRGVVYAGLPSVTGLRLVRSPAGPDEEIRFLLSRYRHLVLPASPGASEASDASHAGQWFTLMRSEPALVDASMAIAVEYDSACPWTQRLEKATMHTWRAVSLISQRLERAPMQLTDGLLAAVFTLAYSEVRNATWRQSRKHLKINALSNLMQLLRNDQRAREVHVSGLAEMVRLRRNQGYGAVQKWFADFLVYDSVSAVVHSPDDYCTKVAAAIGTPNTLLYIRGVATMTKELAELRLRLDTTYSTPRGSRVEGQYIRARVAAVARVMDSLPKLDSPYLQSLEYALRLYLSLLWPSSSSEDVEKADLLMGLRTTLGEPKGRLCSAVNLTAWQFFVGAAAAGDFSEMQTWFVLCLKGILESMRIDGWDKMLAVLARTFMPDGRLLVRFKRVWSQTRG